MTYKEFAKLIDEHNKSIEWFNKLQDLFGESGYNNPGFDFGYKMFEAYLEKAFTEEGRDLIIEYLYHAYSDFDSVSDLWECIKTKQR